MSRCHLIVCEKTGRWAAALRSALGERPPSLVETRSLAGCEAALVDAPHSLVALETTASNLEATLAFVGRSIGRFPRCYFVALLDPEICDAALLIREGGAIATFDSVLDAARIVRLAKRQLARAPRQEAEGRESVWERMPWASFATTPPSTN
jgi:hypothetical protein